MRLVLLALSLALAAPLAAQPAPAAPPAAEAPAEASAEGAAPSASAAGGSLAALPGLQLTDSGEPLALPIQLLLLLTVLSLAPSIIILMTSFTRLIVVLGILRTALGLQQSPPTQLLVGLALFLTFFVMAPVFHQVNDAALKPYLEGAISQEAALEAATGPMKGFMLSQTREKDLLLFADMGGYGAFRSAEDVPLHVLVPAFVISELRIAFQIGFMLFLPFLIVDLIVASVLMSLGMMMLPPVMVSLPIKLLLFVLADGWYLLVESVVRGYLGT